MTNTTVSGSGKKSTPWLTSGAVAMVVAAIIGASVYYWPSTPKPPPVDETRSLTIGIVSDLPRSAGEADRARRDGERRGPRGTHEPDSQGEFELSAPAANAAELLLEVNADGYVP